MKIWCVTGMCMLKVVSSERYLGVKGFLIKEAIIATIACVLQPSYSVYEKAIYAALSGDIKHVSAWLDHDKLPHTPFLLVPIFVYFCAHSYCQLVSPGLTMSGHISESWWTSLRNR